MFESAKRNCFDSNHNTINTKAVTGMLHLIQKYCGYETALECLESLEFSCSQQTKHDFEQESSPQGQLFVLNLHFLIEYLCQEASTQQELQDSDKSQTNDTATHNSLEQVKLVVERNYRINIRI